MRLYHEWLKRKYSINPSKTCFLVGEGKKTDIQEAVLNLIPPFPVLSWNCLSSCIMAFESTISHCYLFTSLLLDHPRVPKGRDSVLLILPSHHVTHRLNDFIIPSQLFSFVKQWQGVMSSSTTLPTPNISPLPAWESQKHRQALEYKVLGIYIKLTLTTLTYWFD